MHINLLTTKLRENGCFKDDFIFDYQLSDVFDLKGDNRTLGIKILVKFVDHKTGDVKNADFEFGKGYENTSVFAEAYLDYRMAVARLERVKKEFA